MKQHEIETKVNNSRPGTFHWIYTSRPLKTLKDVADTITKESRINVQLGCKYDNLAEVKAARASGELPAENQGLAENNQWVDKNFIKNTKTGNIKLRTYPVKNKKVKVTYYKNGKVVDKAEIAPLCYKSEIESRSDGKRLLVMDVGINNILKIN